VYVLKESYLGEVKALLQYVVVFVLLLYLLLTQFVGLVPITKVDMVLDSSPPDTRRIVISNRRADFLWSITRFPESSPIQGFRVSYVRPVLESTSGLCFLVGKSSMLAWLFLEQFTCY
jgi:hypothetical protein